jgi:hypothetical protein|tara:strand:+ start:657 stop:797 length:141 start_codon:yes stop_codon:yes gene_type:complete
MDKKGILSELKVEGMKIKCKLGDLHHHINAWALLKHIENTKGEEKK